VKISKRSHSLICDKSVIDASHTKGSSARICDGSQNVRVIHRFAIRTASKKTKWRQSSRGGESPTFEWAAITKSMSFDFKEKQTTGANEQAHNAAGYRDVEVNDEDDGEGDPVIHHGLIAQRLDDGHVAIERYGDPGPEHKQQMSGRKEMAGSHKRPNNPLPFWKNGLLVIYMSNMDVTVLHKAMK
jgi:hypothetical protein